MAAFISVVSEGLPSNFPRLRFGFIEAGAAWVPYALSALECRAARRFCTTAPQSFDLQRDLFRSDRLYVTIDPVDPVEHLLDMGMEDNLIVGTDYCHSDPSANLAALDEVERWASEGA